MSSIHLDDEQVQRLLHGELAASTASSAAAHLEACMECRLRVRDADRDERRILGLLRRVDHAVPRAELETIIRGSRRSVPAWGRWAAGLLLLVAATGAAYAAPGSPLPGMVERVLARLGTEGRTVVPASPADAATPDNDRASEHGIAVLPGDRFSIAFSHSQPAGQAIVTLSDSSEIVVRADGGRATFASDVDRLAIDNRESSAVFQIRIPRAAPSVEISVAGRRVLWIRKSEVIEGVRRDTTGRYALPLTAPPF